MAAMDSFSSSHASATCAGVASCFSATPSHIRENYGALDVALDETDAERIDGIDRKKRYVDFEAAPWNRA